jgi:hypothetical protein
MDPASRDKATLGTSGVAPVPWVALAPGRRVAAPDASGARAPAVAAPPHASVARAGR